MVNNIFLYKLFIGVKKINGHSGVNFSFNKYFSFNVSHQSFPFYLVESTIEFCGICVVFGEGTVDYFLYKLINLAKFATFLMELSLPAGKFLN